MLVVLITNIGVVQLALLFPILIVLSIILITIVQLVLQDLMPLSTNVAEISKPLPVLQPSVLLSQLPNSARLEYWTAPPIALLVKITITSRATNVALMDIISKVVFVL